MAEITIDNISELWKYLGTVWGNLPLDDKTFIEELWKSYASCVSELSDELDVIKNNRGVSDISPIVTENDNYYDIIYATTDDDIYGDLVNTFTSDGLICYSLQGMVVSVSGIINYHYVDEENTWVAEELTEDVDYVLSGYNTLIFLNDPPFTASADYTTLSRSFIYIEKLEKVNPTLFRLWGAQAEFNSNIFVDESYNCWSRYDSGTRDFELDKAAHYKQIIKGLRYWTFQQPTIKVIKNAVGIAYGLPFAYESGILTHSTGGREYYAEINDQQLWVDNQTELDYIIEGSHDKFELLVDSFNVFDYISNSTLIEQHMDEETEADKRNILIAQTNSGLVDEFPFTRDTDFYTEWLERLIPKQLKLIETTS